MITTALDFTLDLHREWGHAGIRDAQNFDDALGFTLPQEGGEVNDPDDPGGHTNHGITQNTYTRWQLSHGAAAAKDVGGITMNEVVQIYEEGYWLPGHCADMLPVIGMMHFDACVNFGVTGALQILQRAIGVTDDGVWGPVTSTVLGSEGTRLLVEQLCWERLAAYCTKVRQRPIKQKFLRAWTQRVMALRRFALPRVT